MAFFFLLSSYLKRVELQPIVVSIPFWRRVGLAWRALIRPEKTVGEWINTGAQAQISVLLRAAEMDVKKGDAPAGCLCKRCIDAYLGNGTVTHTVTLDNLDKISAELDAQTSAIAAAQRKRS